MDEAEAGAQAPSVTPHHAIDARIEEWWNHHFPGSPLAQVTAAWNIAFAAKEDLKRRLKEGV